MKITTHGDFLIQLTRWPLLFPVNVYLVREKDGLTLIDAGMSGQGDTILAQAKAMGLPITRVALTHAHSDHTGSLEELKNALPEAEILMTERTARFLGGELSLEPEEQKGELRGSFKNVDVAPTRTIEPGDRVGSLEVIAAPGHAPDQIAFLDTRSRSLIAGDAFQTRAGLAVSGTIRLLFPFPALATWHKPTAVESARVLRDLEPSRLAVGHGPVLESPLEEMDRAIDEAAQKVGKQASHAR